MSRRNLRENSAPQTAPASVIMYRGEQCSICELIAEVIAPWLRQKNQSFEVRTLDPNDADWRDFVYKVPVFVCGGRIVAHSLSDIDQIKANLEAAWTNP